MNIDRVTGGYPTIYHILRVVALESCLCAAKKNWCGISRHWMAFKTRMLRRRQQSQTLKSGRMRGSWLDWLGRIGMLMSSALMKHFAGRFGSYFLSFEPLRIENRWQTTNPNFSSLKTPPNYDNFTPCWSAATILMGMLIEHQSRKFSQQPDTPIQMLWTEVKGLFKKVTRLSAHHFLICRVMLHELRIRSLTKQDFI